MGVISREKFIEAATKTAKIYSEFLHKTDVMESLIGSNVCAWIYDSKILDQMIENLSYAIGDTTSMLSYVFVEHQAAFPIMSCVFDKNDELVDLYDWGDVYDYIRDIEED